MARGEVKGTTEDTPTEETGTTEDDETVYEAPGLIDDVIQLFEDFLWIHSGKVFNSEPKADDWAHDDIIYGSQRDELYNDLLTLFSEYSLY